MIKITHPNLEKLALKHYQFLEKKLTNAYSINRLSAQDERIQKIFGTIYNFKTIVLAKPEELEHLAQIWQNTTSNNSEEFSYYRTTLYEEFSTKKISQGKDKESISRALRLVDKLGIIVCPYCNRNFINNTDKHGRRTCDIDHFFSKTAFPFLAVSFYNLIPSCKWCNFVKLDTANTNAEELILNPYDTRDGYTFDASIDLKILDCAFYYKASSLEVQFSENVSERVKKHIEVFHLKDLYAQHTDYALELIQKKYAYSESYIDSLFKQYEGTIFKNREDILRFVTSNFVGEENLSKRPLSKLTMDIVRQLDL